jgi:hypothetical protein
MSGHVCEAYLCSFPGLSITFSRSLFIIKPTSPLLISLPSCRINRPPNLLILAGRPRLTKGKAVFSLDFSRLAAVRPPCLTMASHVMANWRGNPVNAPPCQPRDAESAFIPSVPSCGPECASADARLKRKERTQTKAFGKIRVENKRLLLVSLWSRNTCSTRAPLTMTTSAVRR